MFSYQNVNEMEAPRGYAVFLLCLLHKHAMCSFCLEAEFTVSVSLSFSLSVSLSLSVSILAPC